MRGNDRKQRIDPAEAKAMLKQIQHAAKRGDGGKPHDSYRTLARAVLMQALRDVACVGEGRSATPAEREEAVLFLSTDNEDVAFWRHLAEV